MKKLLAGIGLGCLLLSAHSARAENIKIGFISLSKIFQEYQKVIDANAELDQTKKQVKTAIAKVKELEANYDQLSDKGKEERQAQITAKQEEINRDMTEVRKEEDRILREILKDIEGAAAVLRKKENWTFILDDRLIIDGDSTYDLTEKMLKQLNSGYSSKK